MALWECADCTTRYAVGAPKCPHCGSTLRVNEAAQPPEEDNDMAKITVHGGPSNAAADETQPDPADTGEPGYEDLTVEQLKEQLGDRGLAKTGKRDELVQRLREDDEARAAETPAE